MIIAQHLTAGAPGRMRLCHDDRDAFELLERVHGFAGERLLAYCFMHTHVHVVLESTRETGLDLLASALHSYARYFNPRHRNTAPLLRGPIKSFEVVPDPRELARTISYVHDNPTKTQTPLVPRALFWPWSSVRAYVGLSRDPRVNLDRARALLGAREAWVTYRLDPPPLADLEPSPVPRASPEVMLAASAQVYGVLAEDLAGPGRSPLLRAARSIFVALGRLEALSDAQLAPTIGRSRSRLQQIAGCANLDGVRAARTLCRTPELRKRLTVWRPAVETSQMLPV